MTTGARKTVKIQAVLRRETANAYLIWNGRAEKWVPKSQIVEKHMDRGACVAVTIPEWLAKERGFIE